MRRVKYNNYESSKVYYLPIAEQIMRNFSPERKVQSYHINDIIELFNIKQYIDLDAVLESWSSQDIVSFKTLVKAYPPIIGRFFASMQENEILSLFLSVDHKYEDDFWMIVEQYKVYKNLTQETFCLMMNHSRRILIHILQHKDIVCFFGGYIRERLLGDATSAEILLDKYEIAHLSGERDLYLPKGLTLEDKEKIICKYIISEEVNINYLRLIVNVQKTDDFKISDRTRLAAKKRLEKEEELLRRNNKGIELELKVLFSKNQCEEVVYESKGRNTSITYSSKWIEDNPDYSTLLNNFVYLFEYTDIHFRITLVKRDHEMGVLERHLVTRSKKAYCTGYAFYIKNVLAKLQMSSYCQELSHINVRLEEVIEWFFKEYVKIEFQIVDYRIKMPSVQSSYLEKCRTLLSELESVLKQFILYVEDGIIDHDLQEIFSDHLLYKEIPSLLKYKYVYGKGDNFYLAGHYLFSDQCMLAYVERISKEYKCFFDLIMHENVELDDFLDVSETEINWLLDHSFIFIDEDGLIRPHNIEKIIILKDLYYNEVLSYWRYPQKYQLIIKDMEKEGILDFENSLFSRPEQDYFNYNLNKASFNNALDLRNKYLHGNQPSGEGDEKIHKENYFVFLILLILIIIKINDELCIANSKEYKEHADVCDDRREDAEGKP